jgi:hypothetical protein
VGRPERYVRGFESGSGLLFMGRNSMNRHEGNKKEEIVMKRTFTVLLAVFLFGALTSDASAQWRSYSYYYPNSYYTPYSTSYYSGGSYMPYTGSYDSSGYYTPGTAVYTYPRSYYYSTPSYYYSSPSYYYPGGGTYYYGPRFGFRAGW